MLDEDITGRVNSHPLSNDANENDSSIYCSSIPLLHKTAKIFSPSLTSQPSYQQATEPYNRKAEKLFLPNPYLTES
jgi:hypothetical protein